MKTPSVSWWEIQLLKSIRREKRVWVDSLAQGCGTVFGRGVEEAGAAASGGGGTGWPSGIIVTFLSTTGVRGLSLRSRSTRAMLLTTSTLASSHWPRMV